MRNEHTNHQRYDTASPLYPAAVPPARLGRGRRYDSCWHPDAGFRSPPRSRRIRVAGRVNRSAHAQRSRPARVHVHGLLEVGALAAFSWVYSSCGRHVDCRAVPLIGQAGTRPRLRIRRCANSSRPSLRLHGARSTSSPCFTPIFCTISPRARCASLAVMRPFSNSKQMMHTEKV